VSKTKQQELKKEKKRRKKKKKLPRLSICSLKYFSMQRLGWKLPAETVKLITAVNIFKVMALGVRSRRKYEGIFLISKEK
jgi:hypothetical protein